MKIPITIVFNLIGFLGLALFSYYQLESKVNKIESMVEIYDIRMRLHIVTEINKLKKELKRDNLVFRD